MNPFNYGNVVNEPYFFDRTQEKDHIINTVVGGNNLVLYAPRRYGKTSLIMQVIESLESLGFICIYFDFMAIYSRDTFVEAFSKAILAYQQNWKKTIDSFSRLVKGIRPTISIDQDGNPEFSIEFTEATISDQCLETVIDLPAKLANEKKKFIIFMDEFQDINKLNGENFEKLLRSKIQHHHDVSYVFLGSRTHLLYDMFTNKNRAFYNSASIMHLDTLPRDDTIHFLINRFSMHRIELDKKAASYLIDQAGNIPYYIQFLAAQVWQDCINLKQVVDTDTIDRCARKILILKSDYYFELFDKQTFYQKKLLKALAIQNHNIFSAEYSKKFRLSATSTTQKSLTGLIRNGIIEKFKNRYLFDDPFFRQFVLRLPA